MAQAIISIIGFLLLVAGLIYSFYWNLRFLVAAYHRSLWWFLGCVFVPCAELAFLLSNFKLARKSFSLSLLGLVAAGIGSWMAGIGQ